MAAEISSAMRARIHAAARARAASRASSPGSAPKLGQFLDGMAQIIGIGRARVGRASQCGRFAARCASSSAKRSAGFGRESFMAAESIQQPAMRRRIEQSAIVGLPVDFDDHRAQIAQERHAHRLRR